LITLQNWSFGQKKLLVATEVRQPAPTTRLRFFILRGGGGGGRVRALDFCYSQCVPHKFSIGSQHIPNNFSLYPISLPKVLLLNNINLSKG